VSTCTTCSYTSVLSAIARREVGSPSVGRPLLGAERHDLLVQEDRALTVDRDGRVSCFLLALARLGLHCTDWTMETAVG
jgi:hypothetical protein